MSDSAEQKTRARNGRPRVTIRDVAALAGVSSTTVSHALNGKGRVDPSTRQRVFDAAAKLEYRASRTARALRTKRTGAIAFAIPPFERGPSPAQGLTTHIYMSQASFAASEAFLRDYSLLLIPPVTENDALAAIDVDGGIVCDPMRSDPIYEAFERQGLPVVSIERHPGRPDDPWHVRADNGRDTRRLLDHFAERGAKRIAMLSLDADIAWSAENTGAYRDWSEEHGREPVVFAASPNQLEKSAYEMACRLLDQREPPDAIFASAERFSTGVMRAARERGLRIPEDLMVAAGIDGREARESVPTVTAIDVNPGSQGKAAVELLIARIEGDDIAAPLITPSELHLRESTDRPAG